MTAARTAVVVLAGPEETADVLPAVSALLPARVPVLHGMSIGDFLALVGQFDAVVTADTLALHAAAALRVPVVALVGPMPRAELELGARDRTVNTPLPCAPCYLSCTRSIPGECMSRIGVDQVEQQVRAVLAGRPHRSPVTSGGQSRRGPRSWRSG